MQFSKRVSFIVLFAIVIELDCLICCNEVNMTKLEGPGEPLYLTPLLEKGHISEALHKSIVKPFLKGDKSYAGYFTVDKNFNSNMFFWFFTADDKNWENLPVAVWLEGGPGASSLLAMFIENGPYILIGKKLYKRRDSWHRKCNMIYIDNPVGAGFSFTDNENGYARNQTIISEQLYSAIKQFFVMFPRLLKNDFFLSGQSYAGKYIPEFAYTIHKRNMLASRDQLSNITDHIFINLKGLFIGNGLVDPVNMMEYGDYLHQLGLIDTNSLKRFHKIEMKIKKNIENKRWDKATTTFGELVLGYLFYPSGSLFQNETGLREHYNYVNAYPPNWTRNHTEFVNSDFFRRSVHIGNCTFNNGRTVASFLKEDICKSVARKLEKLLSHYRVVLYNGQLDVICAYPLMVNYIKKMNWSSVEEYKTAERHIWRVNNDVAGYYKTAGNLTEVLIRDAGHFAPSEQPLWAHVLFNKFVYQKHLNDGLY